MIPGGHLRESIVTSIKALTEIWSFKTLGFAQGAYIRLTPLHFLSLHQLVVQLRVINSCYNHSYSRTSNKLILIAFYNTVATIRLPLL